MTGTYFLANPIEDVISLIEPNYKLPKVVIEEKEFISAKEIENLIEPSLYRELQATYVQYMIP